MKRFSKASDIKVGVVGYGGAFNMGRSHLNEMAQAGMTPCAVTELDASRRKVAAEEFPGITTHASVGDMLKKSDVNLVVLITPHNTHAKLAMQCLRAGRHVVAEKPLAITTAECDKMIAEAKKNKVMLSTYHNRHWDGCIMRALKEIKKGVIGDVVRIDCHMGEYAKPGDWWRSSKTISGGILYDWGVHLLEYSLQIMDSEVTEVSGFAHNGHWAPKTKWKKDTIEDEGFAVVRFADGRHCTLRISAIDACPPEGQLVITGTKGTYVLSMWSWKTFTYGKNDTFITTHGGHPKSEGWRLYQNVADHLVKGEKLVITPEWSRRPIHILDLACRSAAQNKTLKVKYS